MQYFKCWKTYTSSCTVSVASHNLFCITGSYLWEHLWLKQQKQPESWDMKCLCIVFYMFFKLNMWSGSSRVLWWVCLWTMQVSCCIASHSNRTLVSKSTYQPELLGKGWLKVLYGSVCLQHILCMDISTAVLNFVLTRHDLAQVQFFYFASMYIWQGKLRIYIFNLLPRHCYLSCRQCLPLEGTHLFKHVNSLYKLHILFSFFFSI